MLHWDSTAPPSSGGGGSTESTRLKRRMSECKTEEKSCDIARCGDGADGKLTDMLLKLKRAKFCFLCVSRPDGRCPRLKHRP